MIVTKPLRQSKAGLDGGWNLPTRESLEQIHRGELVEVPQGGDEPSKFLYKDMGGHVYWVTLLPFVLPSEPKAVSTTQIPKILKHNKNANHSSQ
jgi:hypothetical protein